MKKMIFLTLAAALGVTAAMQAADSDVSGHTFLTVRPQFQSAMPEKSTMFRPSRALYRDNGWHGALQGVVFGGRSTGKHLGKYFMFCGKDSLVVAGDNVDGVNAEQGVGRDVNPFWFNIRGEPGADQDFQSTISFHPRQTVVGGGFEWRQYIGWWGCDCNDEPRWWWDISFPVERVQNSMRLTETGISAQTDPADDTAANMEAAFTGQFPFNPDGTGLDGVWLFGKINGKKRKTGVADVEFKIGYDYICGDMCYASGYFGFIAPTGNTPKAEFVFEPIVGNNHHWGIMTGGYMTFQLWQCGCSNLFFEFETNSRYLFRNTQRRSFDLCNRPWSRYMQVFTAAPTGDPATELTALSPAINYLTQKVKVHPHFQHNWLAGLVFERCGFQAEIGYNFWARQAEGVRLKNDFPTNLAIPLINNGGFVLTDEEDGVPLVSLINTIGANACGTTDPASAFLFTSDGSHITEEQINFESAASPAALTHTIYGSLGYSLDCWCWPVFIGAGASYEFSTNNTALNRWLAWGKIGVSI